MHKYSLLTRFFLHCAGADIQIMSRATTSTVRWYATMGSCVLIPAALALYAGGYTMTLITGTMAAGILFAPVWSAIVFILDRAVVAGTRPGTFSFGVAARIFMALVIAFTISEPLSVRIFKDVIEDRRIQLLEDKTASAIATVDRKIAEINAASQKEKDNADRLNREFISEVDGTAGSKTPYRGPIAEIKWQAYQTALADFRVNEDARKIELAGLQAERKKKINTVDRNDAKGFLGDLRILGKLTDEDTHVWWAVWLMRCLFLCIELVPVFIKTGMPRTKDVYYALKEIDDEDCLALQKDISSEKIAVDKLEQMVLLQHRKNEFQYKLSEGLMNDKTKQYDMFLDKINYAMEQKLKLQDQILFEVKDQVARAEILAQVQTAAELFTRAMEAIMLQSLTENRAA